jgi:hypothetical protein
VHVAKLRAGTWSGRRHLRSLGQVGHSLNAKVDRGVPRLDTYEAIVALFGWLSTYIAPGGRMSYR